MKRTNGINFLRERQRLVKQIKRQGIRDSTVLEAVRSVPREVFVPMELHEFAYQNLPLPIGNDQTISQPFIVALMAAALDLKPDERVLEIGTGSGYAAAVLSRLGKEVYTVERYEDLAETARVRLRDEGFENVNVLHGDGTLGWLAHAPYDAIVVAASGPDVPQPLLDQLCINGRLVIPIGRDRSVQKLVRVQRTGENDYQRQDLGDVRFVPLVGAAGWDGDEQELNNNTIHTTNSDETVDKSDRTNSGTIC